LLGFISFTPTYELRGIFDGRVWWSKPRNSSNLIVFAVKNDHFNPQ